MLLHSCLFSFDGLCQDSPPTLMHGFWPHSHVEVLPLDARLLGNGEVHEEFKEDNRYVRHASNCSPPSFFVGVNCCKKYMFIFCSRDET